MNYEEAAYLAHHGILGQKWGVRRSPEQLGHRTGSGKRKKSLKSVIKSYIRKRQNAKIKKANSQSEDDREQLKEYLRKHPKKLPKYSRVLTEEDANEIIKNIEFDRKLKDIKAEEVRRSWQKVKNFNDRVLTVKQLMSNGVDVYNNTALIFNGLADSRYHKQKMLNPTGNIPKPKKLPKVQWGKMGYGGAFYEGDQYAPDPNNTNDNNKNN